MNETLIIWGLLALGGYFAVGVLFGVVCLIGGVKRIDPAARTMPIRARFLVLPGLAALWPIMLPKLISGKGPPVS